MLERFKRFSKNKSPGNDRFTAEFYSFFNSRIVFFRKKVLAAIMNNAQTDNNRGESAAFVMTSATWLDFLVFSDKDNKP